MSSSVSWKKSKRLDSITVSPDGGDEPQSIHVLSGWLERLYTNQTEDNSIPMSEPDGIPVAEEDGKLRPRCRGGFRPIPCSDFIDWIPTVGLEDLMIKKIALWRSRDPPWHHEFVVVMFNPDDKYTGPNDILLPNLCERVPIQMLVATGLTLRIDRGRRSPVPFGSRQIAVDVVEIMNPDADLGNCDEFWSACVDHSRDVEFFPTMRDLAYFLKNTMAKLGEDYHLLRRNCWNFAARLISLVTFYFLSCWSMIHDHSEIIWARQKFGGFDGFGSIVHHLNGFRQDDMPRHQSPFRGLIDGLRDLRKTFSSNPVGVFSYVWMASLSPALVGDLVDLDVSLIAITYSQVKKSKDNPVCLFQALYTLTMLAKEGDTKAKAILVQSDILERSAKYMQKCQWSGESQRALIHTVINAFHSLFSEGDDIEIGNAFVKSGWILALPRVFIFYPDHIATIGLYFTLQSIEAARSHLIMTSVLHSIFNFIQRFVSVGHIDLSSSSFEDDELMFVFIVMIWKIAEWSPSSRQALLGAGLGTTITKILQSRKALNDMALHYLVKLLEILVLFNPKQDKPNNPLIRKGTVDSLKDAGVFQALQENYPSVLLFQPFAGTHLLAPLDIIEEFASNPLHVMARFLKTHPEHASKVMRDLVKEGVDEGGNVTTAFRSIFPRGLIDGFRDLRKKSSSNLVEFFPYVWMASLSPTLVWDLMDLDVSLIAIAYTHVNKDDLGGLFMALYTLTRLAQKRDSKAKAMLVESDILERSAKYMKTCQLSGESDRVLIHMVVNAFYDLFSEGVDVEIGNAFAKSGWILALPRVFIFNPDNFHIIALYSALLSIEAARSHLITTSVLHSIFNFILQVSKSYNTLKIFIRIIRTIAEWSPSSRQALLDAGLGTTIAKLLRSGKTLNKKTLNCFVELLETLILVSSRQDKHFHSLINKGALDSLKDAGVFQALEENYPSIACEEISDLVKKGKIKERDVTAFLSLFPGVDMSNYGFVPRDTLDSAYTATVANIGGRDLDKEMSWWNADLRNACRRPGPMLTSEDAYAVLENPKNEDESMLCAVFSLWVQEFSAQDEKWREALSIIAKLRGSERLCRFLETATNPADLVVPTPQDMPRGLNQLNNTCYLNSLLQYFYIIRDLRDAIIHFDVKITEGDKLTDNNLERHRVGGRNVTRREIARAKKFVGHLANLFWQMEHYQTASITPAIELANLALLTSKDEEDEKSDKGGMDLSNNALLAGDALSRFPIFESSNSKKPQSVLGKCQRDDSEFIVESPEKDSSKTGPQSKTPSRSGTSLPLEQARPSELSRMTTLVPLNGDDVTIGDSRIEEDPSQKVISLPVRSAEALEPVRMFGQQHDVFECMDNCMFQIETALLKFDESRDESDDKPNVVKRLFYGKIRQCILADTVNQPSIDHNKHSKEDLFSHLPVSVSDDGTDLYDGLSRYMDNVVDYQGRKARMKISVVELPSILHIQLQRAQFDRETKQLYKSQAYVKFWETIYMDRFLETCDPQKKSQSDAIQAQLDACRDQIKALTEVYPYGEQEFMEEEELRVRAINLKKELESIWQNETIAPYELASVFIHDGPSPSWGHYFLYSRHLPECPDSWFKYNDSEVMKVSKNEVLADTMGSTANPYLLVFVRKGQEVIDTVKRVKVMEKCERLSDMLSDH